MSNLVVFKRPHRGKISELKYLFKAMHNNTRNVASSQEIFSQDTTRRVNYSTCKEMEKERGREERRDEASYSNTEGNNDGMLFKPLEETIAANRVHNL